MNKRDRHAADKKEFDRIIARTKEFMAPLLSRWVPTSLTDAPPFEWNFNPYKDVRGRPTMEVEAYMPDLLAARALAERVAAALSRDHFMYEVKADLCHVMLPGEEEETDGIVTVDVRGIINGNCALLFHAMVITKPVPEEVPAW